MNYILVTWSSWFIWYHVAKRLLEDGKYVIGIDNENEYYDISLKKERKRILSTYKNFIRIEKDICIQKDIFDIFDTYHIEKICHLAAQAWVQYSLTHPQSYIEVNICGFFNILEAAKIYKVKNFVYASSSSVYGKNTKLPYLPSDNVDTPISLYAATKKSNELFAHTYSHLYRLPTTGLRFFTVYGEYSRPDMAILKFAQKIQKEEEIEVYNNGESKRDFTYIWDVVEAVVLCLDTPQAYKIYNIGNETPISVNTMIGLLEKYMWKKALCRYTERQLWDVWETWADISDIKNDLWWKPNTSFEDGIKKFIDWFHIYYWK